MLSTARWFAANEDFLGLRSTRSPRSRWCLRKMVMGARGPKRRKTYGFRNNALAIIKHWLYTSHFKISWYIDHKWRNQSGKSIRISINEKHGNIIKPWLEINPCSYTINIIRLTGLISNILPLGPYISFLGETRHMNYGNSSSNSEYYLPCITMLSVSQPIFTWWINPMFILDPNNKDISQINKSVHK